MEKIKEKTDQKRTESFSHISRKSFFVVIALLSFIILLSGVLTYIVPQGHYARNEDGTIIDGTFTEGKAEGLPFWKILTAPARVFASEDALTLIMISVFLLIMSGVFNLLEKTEGIRVIIGKTIKRFSSRKEAVVMVMVFLFMAFGSFFGMFEELVTLLPLVIVLMLSMGFDTLTGLGVCMMASCFGFSAAITNPFSVGIAAGLAGVLVFDGVWLRLVFFALVYGAVCAFLILHMRRIAKDPTRSLTYASDTERRSTLDFAASKEATPEEQRVFRIYLIFFLAQLVVLVLIAGIRAISGLAIPILSVSFLVGGILAGLFVCKHKSDVFRHIAQGAVSMLPAVVMIAFASSVKLIMSESGILDTVMHGVVRMFDGKNRFFCIVLFYFLILFLQVFIGSSSAKIMLIMPIILPIAKTLGLSPTLVIFTYCIADGFTDVILPTNPVLLIGLSMANISYGKWVKWTWKFQTLIFIATILLLLFAVTINY